MVKSRDFIFLKELYIKAEVESKKNLILRDYINNSKKY